MIMRRFILSLIATLAFATPAFPQGTTTINNLPAANAPLYCTEVMASWQVYRTVKIPVALAGAICQSATAPLSPFAGQQWWDTSAGAGVWSLRAYDGASWLPIGRLDTTAHVWTPATNKPVQTVTGTSKTFAATDFQYETRRSNSTSAMTDTFPAAAAGVNGALITVTNVDASASDTITAGSGTTVCGASSCGSTTVVPAGRSLAFVFDSANTAWRPTANTASAVIGPTSVASGDLASFADSTGKTIVDAGFATGQVVTLTGIQTLTNKTLTAPVIGTIVNTGTLTLPTSSDTLVGRATTDTLTNKTLTAPVIATISNTGTLTLPTSSDTLVGRATTDTLTNKTLTAPVMTTPTLGVASATSLSLAGTISGSGIFGTSGIKFKNVAATLTDTTSTGTVPANYNNVFGGNTQTATNATTITNNYGSYLVAPTCSTNVTCTNNYALGADSLNVAGSAVFSGGLSLASNNINSVGVLKFGSSGDTGFSRDGVLGALNVDLGNGSANDKSGTLNLAHISIGGATIGTDALGVTGTSSFSGQSKFLAGVAIGSSLTAAGQGLAPSGSTTNVVGGASGALVHLQDNTGNIYLETTTGLALFGGPAAAAPTAQTIGMQSVVAGTSNTAGVTTTFRNSAGTGTGLGGNMVFQYSPHGSTGTAQNAWASALTINGDTGAITTVSTITGDTFISNGNIQLSAATGAMNFRNGGTPITSPANGGIQFGAADAAAPVAQTLGVQSVVAGTTNTAGAITTIRNSAGTGTGVGGNIVFQFAPHGSTGTAQNAFATALTINGDTGLLTATNGITVSGGSVNINAGSVSASNILPAPTGIIQFGGGGQRSVISAPADGVLALYNNGQTDFSRLQFGGTTASFPAIKRTTTALNFRLADDSADAPITAGAATLSGALTTNVTGSTQCLQVNSSGVVSGSGGNCGAAAATLPTRQVLTSGSGATYTTPASVRQLRIRMVGGGGGGGGNSSSGASGGSGGNTIFNSINAAGGNPGASDGGVGAGGAGGSGTASFRLRGQAGGIGIIGGAQGGGTGGGSALGGGSQNNTSASANTGGGGGGSASASGTSGGGGGGGEYVEYIINSPAGTYTYTIGAGGTAGGAAGAGGSGIIIVDEFY